MEDLKKEIISKSLAIFDKQIKIEYKKNKGRIRECPSYWGKLIFLESSTLSIQDMKEIRTEYYWYMRDKLQGIEQNQFILESILKFKKQNKIALY
jgi:hypothetical protein